MGSSRCFVAIATLLVVCQSVHGEKSSHAILGVTSPQSLNAEELEQLLKRAQGARSACGPMALCLALRLLGHSVPLSDLQVSVDDGVEGVTLANLLAEARRYEPQTQLVTSPDRTLEALPLPAIVVIENRHAVVLASFDKHVRTGLIVDGTTQNVRVLGADAIRRQWSGQAMIFKRYPSSVAIGMLLVGILVTLIADVVLTVGVRPRKARPRSPLP